MFDASAVGKIEVEPGTTRSFASTPRCAGSWYPRRLLARTVLDVTHPDDRMRAAIWVNGLVAGESDVFTWKPTSAKTDDRLGAVT